MFYWNTTGFLGLFVGLGVGIACTGIVSNFSGESQFTKGIGFVAGSAAVIGMDLILRLRHGKSHGIGRLFFGEYGGVAVFPMWCFGLIGLFGGVALLFTTD